VHRVDPLARQIGKSGEVFRPRQPFGLEAAHPAGRGSPIHGRFAADHPAHRRIAAQPIGVVHILVTSQPAEYRLPQQPDQQVRRFPPVRTSANLSPPLVLSASRSSSSRYASNPPSEVIAEPWNHDATGADALVAPTSAAAPSQDFAAPRARR
jgi:hypothetical protein